MKNNKIKISQNEDHKAQWTDPKEKRKKWKRGKGKSSDNIIKCLLPKLGWGR